MNHPDSPRTHDQVATYCAEVGTTQNVMIAVGLAGLSNLQGDKNLNMVARSQYVAALKHTGQLIAANDPSSLVARVRGVVALALFEVNHQPISYRCRDELLTEHRLYKAKALDRQWAQPTHTSMAL